MEYKSHNNVVYSGKYHVVWCSKYHRSVLMGAVEKRLISIIRETAREKQAEVSELEVMPDQVHLRMEVWRRGRCSYSLRRISAGR